MEVKLKVKMTRIEEVKFKVELNVEVKLIVNIQMR